METKTCFRKLSIAPNGSNLGVVRHFFPLILLLAATPAPAAFHLWSIREIYSSTNGQVQYIEMFTTSVGQNQLASQTIRSVNAANTITNTFVIPANSPSATASKALLFATRAFQVANQVPPDFVLVPDYVLTMPSNFLFTGGGTLRFFGSPGVVTYSALPSDGIRARTFPAGTDVVGTPQNFAGQTVTPVSDRLPSLSVEPAGGGNVRVFWRRPGAGLVLDEKLALAGSPLTGWTQVPFPYQTNPTHISITLGIPPTNKFYRLRCP